MKNNRQIREMVREGVFFLKQGMGNDCLLGINLMEVVEFVFSNPMKKFPSLLP